MRLRPRVVSKVFVNEDFGYQKVTVERPLRLNFAATPERIARLEDVKAFQNLARSRKRAGPAHDDEMAAGSARQQEIRELLEVLCEETDGALYDDREMFVAALEDVVKARRSRLSASERKAVLAALGERDSDAEICRDRRGNDEPDPELRDTENVPLDQEIDEYMKREVLPHVPDAWVDASKTKIGYEIPLNRHFYVYEPPRPLEEIEADIQSLEREIVGLLSDVVRS